MIAVTVKSASAAIVAESPIIAFAMDRRRRKRLLLHGRAGRLAADLVDVGLGHGGQCLGEGRDFRFGEVHEGIVAGRTGRFDGSVALGEVSLLGRARELPALRGIDRGAGDAAKGRELSRSAEEGYFAEGDAAIEAARSAGDNTFVDLSEAEVAAFAEALSTVTQSYVDEVGGEATRAAMQK